MSVHHTVTALKGDPGQIIPDHYRIGRHSSAYQIGGRKKWICSGRDEGHGLQHRLPVGQKYTPTD
jgi:hypothetical protein